MRTELLELLAEDDFEIQDQYTEFTADRGDVRVVLLEDGGVELYVFDEFRCLRYRAEFSDLTPVSLIVQAIGYAMKESSALATV